MAHLIEKNQSTDLNRIKELKILIRDLNIEGVKHDFALLLLEKPIQREKYFSLINDLDPFPLLTVSGCVNDPFSGTIRQITHSNALPYKKDDGIIYAIDTKFGQNGSPVYITDKNDVQLLGIHKAYSVRDKLNIAVFITADLIAILEKWAVEMNTSFIVLSMKNIAL